MWDELYCEMASEEISTSQDALCSYPRGREGCQLSSISCFYNIPRRDHLDADLRDKINKRRSPLRRYSPDGDARARHTSHGHSSPRSLGKRRKHKKRQKLDGQIDTSGGVKISEWTEDDLKYKKVASSDSKEVLDDQLRRVQSKVEILGEHKRKLEISLEEKAQEVDSLNSGIQELEMQLSKEREEYHRMTSRIKKFIKAHNRHSQLLDELKRSQARLQKLSDQLGSDASRPGANEGNLNINFASDVETIGNTRSQQNEFQNNESPCKKRSRIHLEVDDDFRRGANLFKEDGYIAQPNRSEELHKFYAHHVQSNNDKEDGSKREKFKSSESGFQLPPTSMAAHAVDVVEVEIGEKFEVSGNASGAFARDTGNEMVGLPFPLVPPPPPPSILQNAYSQYKSGDDNVDIDGLDEETLDVDIV